MRVTLRLGGASVHCTLPCRLAARGHSPSTHPPPGLLRPPCHPPTLPPTHPSPLASFAAFLLLVLTYGAALYFGFYTRQLDLSWLHSHGLELLTACVIFSTLLSIGLYAASFRWAGVLRGSAGGAQTRQHTLHAAVHPPVRRVPQGGLFPAQRVVQGRKKNSSSPPG